MTAHAAKGLEAPVVFLVDNGSAPFSEQHLPRLLPFESAARPVAGQRLSVALRQRDRQRVFAGAAGARKEAAEEEYRRLLYVGMTRAEDRLIVCGYHGKARPASDDVARAGQRGTGRRRTSEELARSLCRRDRHRYRVTKAREAVPAEEFGLRSKRPPMRFPVSFSPPCRNQPALPRPLSPVAVRQPRSGRPIEPVLSPDRRCSMRTRNRALPSRAALRSTGCCRCCPRCPNRSGLTRPPLSCSGGGGLARCREAAGVDAVMRILRDQLLRRCFRRSPAPKWRSWERSRKGRRACHVRQDRPSGGDGRRGA